MADTVNGYDSMYQGKGRTKIERGEAIDLLAEKRAKEQPIIHPKTLEIVQAAQEELSRREFREVVGPCGDPIPEIEQAKAELLALFAKRPTRDEFFLQMAQLASTMATCPRAHCGAVIVRHKRPLSIGYNGADEGEEHCPTEGEALAEHLKLDHCDRSTHAEINAIKNSVGNVYGHYRPCPPCEAELNRVGITDIRHRPGPRVGPENNWG